MLRIAPEDGETLPSELGLQRGDPRLQRLVFLPRQPRHVLDRLELLALDEVLATLNIR
jgi:hypothetical protein